MSDEPDKLSANREVWNQAADKYDKPANALPMWGPYHVCQHDSTLIGPIEGASKQDFAQNCSAPRSSHPDLVP